MPFHRFNVVFHHYDSPTQRGYNSTYITWSVTWFHALIYVEYMKYLSLVCFLPANELNLRHGIEFVLNPVNGQFITKTAAMFTGCRARFRVELEWSYCKTNIARRFCVNQSINQSINQSLNHLTNQVYFSNPVNNYKYMVEYQRNLYRQKYVILPFLWSKHPNLSYYTFITFVYD